MDSLSKTELKKLYGNELKKLLSGKSFSKSKVLNILVYVRHFHDFDKDFPQILKFFCDWAFHAKKDNHLNLKKDKYKTKQLIGEIFDDFLNVTLYDKGSSAQINNHGKFLILIKPFMDELLGFLSKEKIPHQKILDNYNIFSHRVGELISFKPVAINEELSLEISPVRECTCFEIVFQTICSDCQNKGLKHSLDFKS